MEMITCFPKLPALLLLFLFIRESSSFPLLVRGASVQDIEKNSMVLEDIQSNQQIIEEEKIQNEDLMNMINPITLPPLFDNWLGGERLAAVEEEDKVGGENEALPPQLSDLRSFTTRPVTLGYWNWHWRRK